MWITKPKSKPPSINTSGLTIYTGTLKPNNYKIYTGGHLEMANQYNDAVNSFLTKKEFEEFKQELYATVMAKIDTKAFVGHNIV